MKERKGWEFKKQGNKLHERFVLSCLMCGPFHGNSMAPADSHECDLSGGCRPPATRDKSRQ